MCGVIKKLLSYSHIGQWSDASLDSFQQTHIESFTQLEAWIILVIKHYIPNYYYLYTNVRKNILNPVFKEVFPTKKKQELILENCADAGKPSFNSFPFSINSAFLHILHFLKFERTELVWKIIHCCCISKISRPKDLFVC